MTDLAAVDPDGRLAGTVALVLDNACLHAIPDQRRPGWYLYPPRAAVAA